MVRTRIVRLALLIALLAFAAPSTMPSPVGAAATIDCASPGPDPTVAGTPAATPLPTIVADAPFPAAGGELTVFAAASLTGAFTQIGDDLMAAHPGLAITFNFAGSSTLVTQLVEGASADLFAAASPAQMTKAVAGGVIAAEPQVVTRNRLAIAVPADNPAGIASLADLADDGVSLVVGIPDLPAGQYARQVVCAAASDPATYGDDFAARVAANVVSEEENVRAVLAKVRLGEADAGIVYTTDIDAAAAADVLLIQIPAAVNVVATYPIAPVAGGDAPLAAAFIAYVLGPDGQATLAAFGFEPPA